MENNKKLGVDYSPKEIELLYEELDELTNGEIDEKSLNRIIEINEILYNLNPAAAIPSAEDSWKEFSEKYLSDSISTKKQSSIKSIHKSILLIAAILIIVFSGSIMAGANVFDIIHRWGDETVQVEPGVDSSSNDNQFKTFKNIDELEDYIGFKIMKPRFEDAENLSIDIEYYDANGLIVIYYVNKITSDLISLKIKTVDNKSVIQFEKDPGVAETVEQNGINYYIFKNTVYTKINWGYNSMVYSISGTFDNDEAKKIIKTIK